MRSVMFKGGETNQPEGRPLKAYAICIAPAPITLVVHISVSKVVPPRGGSVSLRLSPRDGDLRTLQ